MITTAAPSKVEIKDSLDLMLFKNDLICFSIMKVGTFVGETNYFRIVNNTKVNVKREKTSYYVADPTGFEPAIFSVTGRRVKPGYTTGPFQFSVYDTIFVKKYEFCEN